MTKQGNQIYRNSSGNSKKNGIYAVNVAPTYFLLKKKNKHGKRHNVGYSKIGRNKYVE